VPAARISALDAGEAGRLGAACAPGEAALRSAAAE
jgi:hypothetical protein